MNPNELIVTLNELKPGDVILFASGSDAPTIVEIRKATNSKYTHAAICVSSSKAGHVTPRGVKNDSIQNILDRFGHAVVFRNKLAWTEIRVKALTRFLDQAIQACTGYDFDGFRTFLERNQDHQMRLLEKLKGYFDGKVQPQNHRKEAYTCSELIAACFVEVGFISPSASIALQSDTFSPGSLGRESTFGFLLGYLKPNEITVIPPDDEFANCVTFRELEKAEEDLRKYSAAPNYEELHSDA